MSRRHSVSATLDRAPEVRATPQVTGWVHRPELDGLRTVAVYLVLLFHAGVGGFSGGFIGVDLFFVLSGFLVSSILLEEALTRGRVDLPRFFARRVRRLLPAAVVVVVATSLVSVLTSSVVARVPWTGDAQSALLYVSNWRFLSQSGDYFGPDIDKSPFLHFWSLSVEEQFYVAFPVLLVTLLAVRTGRRTRLLVGVVAGLAAASVLSQLYWSAHDPDRAYYATDARIYQLLAGVLVAVLWRRIRSRSAPDVGRPLRHPAGALALLAVLVVVATPLVQVTASQRGLLATALSAPLVLVVMTGVDPTAGWLLTRPVMTYLGRISYGIYLWHWPVVLTLLQVFHTGPLVIATLTAGIATGLAAVSFEVLERPIRSSRTLARAPVATVAVGIGISALVAVTVVPLVLGSDRPPAISVGTRPPPDEVLPTGTVPAGLHWKALSQEDGLDNIFCTPADTGSCLLHQGSGPRVMIVGDSHSRVLGEALLALAKRHDFSLYGSIVGRCSWFPHTTSATQDETEARDCHAARDHLYPELVRALHIDVVVLAQLPRPELVSDAQPQLAYPQLAAGAVRQVTHSIESAGADTVIVTSMLTTIADPLGCLSAAHDQSECERVQGPADPLDSYYATAAAESPHVATVDVNQVMCPGYPLCAAVLDGLPVWRDGKHYLPDSLVTHADQIWGQLSATGFFDRAS